MKPKMNAHGDAVLVAAGLQTIANELNLIRLSLFALCPDKDRKALTRIIEQADIQHAQGLQNISNAMFPTERMTR